MTRETQEYWGWGGVSLSLLQGDLPDPGIEPWSLALQVGSLPAELPGKLISIFNTNVYV